MISTKNSDNKTERKKKRRAINCKENECPGNLLNRYDLHINEKGNEKTETKKRREKKIGEREKTTRRKLKNCRLTAWLPYNDHPAMLCKICIYSLFL